ncbi:MAG: glycoside hydrolase [Chitinophagaceae bacterium]|nr:glycoside hydrolase [Chitinophagaceae bacterium]
MKVLFAAILALATLPALSQNKKEIKRIEQKNETHFQKMSAEEVKRYERKLMRQVADLALIPPAINTSPLPKYDYNTQHYVMSLTIERTTGGRLWAAWIGECDCANSYLLAATSDDNGETWSKPRLVIDARSQSIPIQRTVIIGNFWTDPLGRLWLFFDQTMNAFDGRSGLWSIVCENPDDESPIWSEPKRISHGSMLNKPVVLSSGEWLLPSYLLQNNGFGPFSRVFPELDPYRGVNILVSADEGKTWKLRGVRSFPNPDWHEPMIIEKNDGILWMMTRTQKGIMESFSADKGYTWSEPAFTRADIQHPSSRFFFRRLKSGRILLIKNGKELHKNEGRNYFSAWLSEDDGETWKGGLVIDDRPNVSYPDGFQSPDGTIYIAYEHNRGPGEITLARFTEDDVLNGEIVSAQSRLQTIMVQPGKSKK